MRTSNPKYLNQVNKESKQQESSIYNSQITSDIHSNFNYTKFCQAVLDKINFVRVSPKLYIKELEFFKESLDYDNILRLKKSPEEIYIQEGKELFEELINVLKRQCKREPFQANRALVATAEDFMLKLQMHDGSDNKMLIKNVEDFVKRIGKYGVPHGLLAECVDYSSTTAEHLVLKLLLDDGDKARIDRNILLNTSLNFIGISTGMLPTTQNFITVIDFCEHFYNFNQKVSVSLGIATIPKVQVHSKKKSSALDYLHKEKNFAGNRNSLCEVNGLNKGKYSLNSTQNYGNCAIKTNGDIGLRSRRAVDLVEVSNKFQNVMISSAVPNNFRLSVTANNLRLSATAINLNINSQQNKFAAVDLKNDLTYTEKLENSKFQNILSKVNPDKILLQGKFMNRVKSQTRLKSCENGRNISKSTNTRENEDESIYGPLIKKNNPQIDLSRSMMYNGSLLEQEDKRKRTYNPNISVNRNNNFKSIYNNEKRHPDDKFYDQNNEYNFDDLVRNIEIENNGYVKCINTNKKIIIENGAEKYLVKRKIYFTDGSLDEWCYKEEKQ